MKFAGRSKFVQAALVVFVCVNYFFPNLGNAADGKANFRNYVQAFVPKDYRNSQGEFLVRKWSRPIKIASIGQPLISNDFRSYMDELEALTGIEINLQTDGDINVVVLISDNIGRDFANYRDLFSDFYVSSEHYERTKSYLNSGKEKCFYSISAYNQEIKGGFILIDSKVNRRRLDKCLKSRLVGLLGFEAKRGTGISSILEDGSEITELTEIDEEAISRIYSDKGDVNYHNLVE